MRDDELRSAMQSADPSEYVRKYFTPGRKVDEKELLTLVKSATIEKTPSGDHAIFDGKSFSYSYQLMRYIQELT